jgi:hypothetical protein
LACRNLGAPFNLCWASPLVSASGKIAAIYAYQPNFAELEAGAAANSAIDSDEKASRSHDNVSPGA